MKRFKLAVLMLVLLVMMLAAIPAFAVTDGELDGELHPHVVLVVADTADGGGWRCSGTMLTPYYVLTAGHCVSNSPDEDTNPVVAMRIFIQSDVQAGIADGTNNYPDGDGTEDTSREAAAWYAHPEYDGNAFFLHDAGVVVLAEPYYVPGDVYGTLPAVNSLDALKPSKHTWFTSVGYGLQRINPVFVEGSRTRYYATPHLLQINTPGFTGSFSLMLSNNHASGGTCFGDSGGPNFLEDTTTVAGVTSFGINGNCAGTGGVFRVDRANVLDFIYDYWAE